MDSSPDTAEGAAELQQLQRLPKDELVHLAEGLGLDPTRYKTPQRLAMAIHQRRVMIAAMDRQAMLDVIRWGRRPVSATATKEQLAQEIARIRSMRFSGLSLRGLLVLAVLRGVELDGKEDQADLIRKLKRQEGLFNKLRRKSRAWIGSVVSSILGEDEQQDYQFLPPQQLSAGESADQTGSSPLPAGSIKQEIEEAGLFGGLASRVKRSADQYINQKLDEIEQRIDRKLEEIDRRLAEWRDKEVANRLRILKITLWASVIVSIISLIYSYIQVYIRPH